MDRPAAKRGRGGKRPGAGRPKGVAEPLKRGEGPAIQALRWRVKDGTPPEAAELADEAFGRIVQVMRGEVFYQQAPSMLKASTQVREEICGPLAQKLEHSGPGGEALTIEIRKESDDGEAGG